MGRYIDRSPLTETRGPAAVVLGDGLTALGVTRCLVRREVPVRHLSSGSGMVETCRWYRPLTEDRYPRLERDPEFLESRLGEMLPSGGVLFPCTDVSVITVAEMTAGDRGPFTSFLPSPEVVEGFVDKARLLELCRRTDVPQPPTVTIESEGRLRSLDSAWFGGALLKPSRSQQFHRRYGLKSIPIGSRAEALDAYRRYFADDAGVVLQRLVPGPASEHLFLDGYRSPDGRLKGLLARDRERMHPPRTGNSSATVTVPLSGVGTARDHLTRLLEGADFHGIFNAEFKKDGSGDVRLIEVNVRPWWYIEFAARCGVDTCAMAYVEALGGNAEPDLDYEVGRRCIFFDLDLRAAVAEVRAGRFGPGDVLSSWMGSDRAIFAWDDPVAALRMTARRAWRALRSRIVRVLPS